MADTTIVIASELIDFRVSGRRLTAFPNAGTYLSIEKASNRSTAIEGQHNTLTHVRNNGKLYTVTVTVMQGHPDDAFMQAAIRLLDSTTNVLAVSLAYSGTVYTSNNCDIQVVPTRELAADASPPMAYALTGTFPQIIVGAFGQPTVATEDQVANLIP